MEVDVLKEIAPITHPVHSDAHSFYSVQQSFYLPENHSLKLEIKLIHQENLGIAYAYQRFPESNGVIFLVVGPCITPRALIHSLRIVDTVLELKSWSMVSIRIWNYLETMYSITILRHKRFEVFGCRNYLPIQKIVHLHNRSSSLKHPPWVRVPLAFLGCQHCFPDGGFSNAD